MNDLAAELGLSQTTVSHVLRGRHAEFRISAETVARVKAAAAKHGYQRSALAMALRNKRSRSVALVVEDLTNPFWTGIALGAEREAEDQGYLLVISNTNGDLDRERRALDLVRDARVDGLILPPFAMAQRDLIALQAEGHPFVQIDRSLSGVAVPCVRTDHAAGARLAVEHLASLDHQRIAVLTGPSRIQPYQYRLRGAHAALHARAMAPACVTIVDPVDTESARIAAAGMLKSRPRPTAIFSTSIWLTVGLLRAVRDQGLSVPGDLDIVGFDDLNLADLLRYPVTTVAQDVEGIGREAFRLLLKVCANDKPPRRVLLPPRLIVRDSYTVC